MALRAGRAVPALALAGVLVAVPQVRDVTAAAAMAATGQLSGGQAGHVTSDLTDWAAAGTRNAPASRRGRPHGRGTARTGTARTGTARTRAARRGAVTAASRAPARHRRARRGKPALTCSGYGGMLPENYAAIVGFLSAHGYTRLAAAGIAGNIYQESKGNPESVGTGGGGLIGWTPLPGGFVTGNPAADLRTQLRAILAYDQQWAQYLPALNAATSATQAADIYMTYFERPGMPAAANREAAAAAVAAACHL